MRFFSFRPKLTQTTLTILAAIFLALGLISSTGKVYSDAADSQLPFSGSVVTNPYTGNKTLTIQGGWVWSTHHKDCNIDRYAVGWAVDWHDANQPGNLVGSINGTTVRVGAQNSSGLNPSDNNVHVYASPPRCGVFNSGLGYNTGNWGPISHTYPASANAITACVVTYDVHAGQNGQPKSGDLVAGGTSHNTDNSVQSNKNTPLGNNCFPFYIPTLSSHANDTNVHVGDAISDKATLTGASANASGVVTFRLYGPNDSSCTTQAIATGTKSISAAGSSTYSATSGSQVVSAPGVYRWVASYGGDKQNSQALGQCNDSNENVTVSAGTQDAIDGITKNKNNNLPDQLPNTGAGRTVGTFIAVSALAGFSHFYLAKKRRAKADY